ncbi:uncharacterized protein EDB91DRAFT_1250242 [Suillus paluster]|uniref:uncharacterized protein n=1 Tax=Suillus paluster TaxID=48578 RepID=UPI001B863653|nr:uncharacterized protein EDB91DRAFT_1250242 [Suillus paluster]KAG1735909.1 hypothetical protein EDB91DRAFT_1250242 [Suillus paluster]
MAPEYSNAAENLSPLILFYAVGCDAELNKQLCREQGVQGFPTSLNVFPRAHPLGLALRAQQSKTPPAHLQHPSVTRKGLALNLISWWPRVTPRLPTDLPGVVILNKDKKLPLLWEVLANNYCKRMTFGYHTNPDSAFASSLGFPTTVEGRTSLGQRAGLV